MRVRRSATVYRRELRAEMLRAYGSRCACCGERIPELLTLEHVAGDGARHREAVGKNAQAQLVDLKKRGWPREGYTVLCFSCNLGKGSGESCPHTWSQYQSEEWLRG